MLSSLPVVQQAAIGDCLSFDPFPFDQNGPVPPEVDVGWHQTLKNRILLENYYLPGDLEAQMSVVRVFGTGGGLK